MGYGEGEIKVEVDGIGRYKWGRQEYVPKS